MQHLELQLSKPLAWENTSFVWEADKCFRYVRMRVFSELTFV